jgi:hypothetical protein
MLRSGRMSSAGPATSASGAINCASVEAALDAITRLSNINIDGHTLKLSFTPQ